MKSRLILFELNEVPWRVVDDYVAEEPHSAFAKLRSVGIGMSTVAPDVGHLSPWITWPTLHRGVSNELHGISSFGQPMQEVNRNYPPIWDLLASDSVSTGVFGSLHSYPIPPVSPQMYFHVPDTFSPASDCHPSWVEPFQRFNLAMVEQSARNVASGVPAAGLRFLSHAISVGISGGTAIRALEQLASEQITPWRKTRRRSFQALFGFDVFMKLMHTRQPRFATFFTNHVASSMHRYWAARYPKDFSTNEFDEKWIRRYNGEIAFAMKIADRLLSQLMQYCRDRKDTLLVVASSMGQSANEARKIEKQLILAEPERLFDVIGLSRSTWRRCPAMIPQFNFSIDAGCISTFTQALDGLQIQGERVSFLIKEEGFASINLGQTNVSDESFAILHGRRYSLDEIGLRNLKIEDEAGSTAYHIPEGILIIYDPVREVGTRREHCICTTEIAPAICRYFQTSVPGYMSKNSSLQFAGG